MQPTRSACHQIFGAKRVWIDPPMHVVDNLLLADSSACQEDTSLLGTPNVCPKFVLSIQFDLCNQDSPQLWTTFLTQLSLSNSYAVASVRLSVCLSVKQERFVALGVVDPLLCEQVPLGQVTWQNQKSAPYDFFPCLISGIGLVQNLAVA
jgi:hypothetical protein